MVIIFGSRLLVPQFAAGLPMNSMNSVALPVQLKPGNLAIQFCTEIECSLEHAFLRDGDVKIQMIASGPATETVKHFSFQVDGERPALG